MDAWDTAFIDLVEPGYILFDERGGAFVFGCVTGSIAGTFDAKTIDFTWDGSNEMDEANGDGRADLQDDGALVGEIKFHNGDESTFTARPWTTSSTTC